jgi:hypothetical protein
MQPFIPTLATVFEENSAATEPAKRKYRGGRRSPQARKRRIFLLNSKVKINRKFFRENRRSNPRSKLPRYKSKHLVSSALNASFGSHSSVLKNEAKRDPSSSSGKAFIGPRSARLCGTFNVKSLAEKWRRSELLFYCISKGLVVLAIQEHHIFFEDTNPIRKEQLGRGWMFIYTSATKDSSGANIGGVGFFVSPQAYCSIDFIKSEGCLRILHMQLSGDKDSKKQKTFKTNFVNVYSPTATRKAETEVVTFYQNLQVVLTNIPIGHITITLGDFNAQLYKQYANIKFSPNKASNKNSESLYAFMLENDLVAINTTFCKRKGKLITFLGCKKPKASERKVTKRKVCLDYMLVNKKWTRSFRDCEAIFPNLTFSSDHKLLIGKIKWRLRSKTKAPTKPKLRDWKYLKNEKILIEFFKHFQQEKIDLNLPLTESYEELLISIRDAAEAIIPEKELFKKKFIWEDKEICSMRDDLKAAKVLYRQNPTAENRMASNSLSLQFTKLYMEKTEEYFIQLGEEIAQLYGDQKYKASWNLINVVGKRKIRSTGIISAKDPEDRVKLWYNHFNTLLSPQSMTEEENINLPPIPEFADVTFNTEPITAEELRNALKGFKSGKACGKDGIPPEVLQLEVVQKILLEYCNTCLSTGSAPDQWLKQLIIPVPKKGDLTKCTNYRGIALMSYAAKGYNKILLMRLRDGLESKLRYNQNGFRPDRSTLQHVLALRRLFEVAKTKKNFRFVCTFIDFCKAFDSVKWNYIEAILIAYNVPVILVNAIMALYKGASAEVVTSDGISDEIALSVGVLQGDTLAPYLFDIVIDYVLRKATEKQTLGITLHSAKGTKTRTTQEGLYLTDLDYADDIALLSSNFEDAQKLLTRVEEEALKVGLKINRGKTEYMLGGVWGEAGEIRRKTSKKSSKKTKKSRRKPKLKQSDLPELTILDGVIKRVNDFKYLGCWLLSSFKDFEVRRSLAWQAAKDMGRLWHMDFSRKTRLRIFHSVIESILLYGSETWTLTKQMTLRLDGCYTKLLRYILNIKYNPDAEHQVSNAEVYKDDVRPVSQVLRERRLRFVGHCMRSNQPIADILLWDCDNHLEKEGGKGLVRRGQGNTKTYVKQLFEDINGSYEYGREMVNDLREEMLNREVWRNIIREVSNAQKNKLLNNNNNTSTNSNTTTTTKRRGRPPGKRVTQSHDISPIKGAAKRRARVPDF